MIHKAIQFLLLVFLLFVGFATMCAAQQGSSLVGMYQDYQLLIGLKVSRVNYSIDPPNDRKGGTYLPCAEVEMGERCGNYAQSGNFGHTPDSEHGIDWTIGITGPYNFFGDSIFGYQLAFDGQFIQLESEEQGYSNSGLPPSLGGGNGSPGREKLLEKNATAKLDGYFVAATPVFFFAPLKGQNYLFKIGIGVGIGYVDISGEIGDGYIKTVENQTSSDQDYLNQSSTFYFDWAGSVYTLKYSLELAIYSLRLSYGGDFWFAMQADSIAEPNWNEGPVLKLTYAHPIF